MTKPIEVGCIVEVVHVYRNPLRRAWLGRQLVVTGTYVGTSSVFPEPHLRFTTSPAPPTPSKGWHPTALRRIDPPDWEAPRIQEKELTT